jgi:hypothetical protein
MNLRDFCKQNNMTCKNCSMSYKNYRSETLWELYCYDSKVDEDEMCLNWTDEEKL